MAADKTFPGELEQMVLLAMLQLGDDAHAPDIARHLEQTAGRSVSRGSLYTVLGRLESKGMVRWQVERSSSGDGERGGYPKRRFEVTAAGVEALRDARAALMSLWRGLDEVLPEDLS